jgi:cyclohexa-1,5-dienecarbonyl-CoA hydratase
MSESLRAWVDGDGRLLRLRLNRPRANLIDRAMIEALQQGFDRHLGNADLTAVLLDAEGSDFSFGASVEEHLPGSCAEMLRGLHALVRTMIASPVAILVAVQGRCLGGGLEVAAAGTLLFAAADAQLGQPEMKLGVFAPAASCLLPERIGQARAEDLLLSGRTLRGDEAAAIGLVNAVAADPERAALAYFDAHLAGKSASSLRHAVRAARAGFAERVSAKIEVVEKLYLEGLMATRDAVEGLQAFLGKRPAIWENR